MNNKKKLKTKTDKRSKKTLQPVLKLENIIEHEDDETLVDFLLSDLVYEPEN